jgi:RNA-directed DNA polymerase
VRRSGEDGVRKRSLLQESPREVPAGHTAAGEARPVGRHTDKVESGSESEHRPPAALGEAASNLAPSQPGRVSTEDQSKPVRKAHSLIDKVYRWENLYTAWRRVRANKGAHGLDRVTIRHFEADWEVHLREIQRQLIEKRYTPLPVRRVYIPKASDSKQRRPLGIPTVADRIVGQALLQILDPLFDSSMSERSFGFRKGRKAHHAIATVIRDAREGYRYVVDADIASFFDRISHQVTMSLVKARIADGRVLRLIEAFLKAGVCEDGSVHVPAEGTPQGGVISPWLSNLVLDVLDKALEGRGLRHVRYADDFVVLTRTRQEAEDALAFVAEVLGTLRLSLHETKTRLTDVHEGFEFLGFRFRRSRLGIRAKSLDLFKDKIRTLTRRQQGRNVEAVIADVNAFLRGWSGYFGVAEVSCTFRWLDSWIRMRIRSFRFQRRCHNDNWRLTNKRLAKWGLLSLHQCRPSYRLSLVDTPTRQSGSGLLAMRNPRGVAQCGNAAC